MKGNIKISVVTPSFNQVDFIEETIQSILSQSYKNFEYIVIDGGSTDGSADVIKKYQDRLTYWVSEQDQGQSDAINKGFRQATGDLLCWVNSDDVLFPDCLKLIARHYVEKHDPDIIHTWGVYIDANGRITRLNRLPRQSRFLFFRGVWRACAPTMFFKASSLWEVGGLNIGLHLSMDLDLWMKMLKSGAQVERVPGYLGAFRRHGSSKTSISSTGMSSTSENLETRRIFGEGLPAISERRRRWWRLSAWRAYQLINLNYSRSYLELQRVKNKHWKEVFGREGLQ